MNEICRTLSCYDVRICVSGCYVDNCLGTVVEYCQYSRQSCAVTNEVKIFDVRIQVNSKIFQVLN